MKSRSSAYVICFLLAIILTMLPAALFMDLATPFATWENWYQDRTGARPDFRNAKTPSELRAEEAIFRLAVVPPGAVAKTLLGWSGTYAGPYLYPMGTSFHKTAVYPPLALALEHGRVALPFWFLLFAGVYELFRFLRRPRYREPAVA
jgi:hypothetical protein